MRRYSVPKLVGRGGYRFEMRRDVVKEFRLVGDRHRAIRGISAAFHANFPLERRLNSDTFSFSRLDEEWHDGCRARTNEPKGGRALQREVNRAEASPARRLLGAVQLCADEYGGEMLGERDIHHARRLHVPRQSGAIAGALAGADIDRHACTRHRLPGDSRRHQVLEELWQSPGLPAGDLSRLLQQQTRAKSGK